MEQAIHRNKGNGLSGQRKKTAERLLSYGYGVAAQKSRDPARGAAGLHDGLLRAEYRF